MLVLIGLVITVMLLLHRDAAEEAHERAIDQALLLELTGHFDEPMMKRY